MMAIMPRSFAEGFNGSETHGFVILNQQGMRWMQDGFWRSEESARMALAERHWSEIMPGPDGKPMRWFTIVPAVRTISWEVPSI